jgi:hypothetical protein
MAFASVRHLRIALWLGSFVCVAVSFLFMFKAGCAGDLKGGSLGDLEQAMDHEGGGVFIGWLGLLLASAATASTPKFDLVQRVGCAIAVGVVGLVALTVVGIQFEVWGVQSCFSHP